MSINVLSQRIAWWGNAIQFVMQLGTMNGLNSYSEPDNYTVCKNGIRMHRLSFSISTGKYWRIRREMSRSSLPFFACE